MLIWFPSEKYIIIYVCKVLEFENIVYISLLTAQFDLKNYFRYDYLLRSYSRDRFSYSRVNIRISVE